MPISLIHAQLAVTATVYSGVVGLWALYLALRKRGLSSSLWGALAINELIFIAQAGFGIALWIEGLRPARAVHWLYGLLGILTLPAAFAFTRGRGERREALIYALVCLFLAGVAIRATLTAGA